jgi:hypothetical protein
MVSNLKESKERLSYHLSENKAQISWMSEF